MTAMTRCPPRTALQLTLALALAGALALIPLPGLFGLRSATPGAAQTWLALAAMIALITAAVLAGYCGPAADPAQRPRWVRVVSGVADVSVTVLVGLMLLPRLYDITIGGDRPEWLQRVEFVFSLLTRIPYETVMIIPILICGFALLRYARHSKTSG